MRLIPKYCFFTTGVGKGKEKLISFEDALRKAGIAAYNLVKVSSILPPNCEIISKEKGLERLIPGQILYCVLAENSTNEPYRLISASIGAAIPKDKSKYGYLSEYHDFGVTNSKAGEYAEKLAVQMLLTGWGIPFNENDYDKKKICEKHRIITKNITQSAIGDKGGLWTTVIVAAALLV